MSILTRQGDSTTSAAQWLESFLERVCQPTYHLSNTITALEREFEKARLDDTLALVNRKISYLERKRRDIVFREVVENTVARRDLKLGDGGRCRFRAVVVKGNAQTKQALSASAKQTIRASDPFPFSTIDNKPRIDSRTKTDKEKPSRLRIKDTLPRDTDAKTLMLDNERKIQWYKKLRTDVRRAMRARQRIFSSVYRVPVEVWGRVFLFCLPDTSGYSGDGYDEYDYSNLNDADTEAKGGRRSSVYPTLSPQTAPLLLCSVCHTWRVAATQTPALWSALTISLSVSAQRTSRLPVLRTWIARAGSVPLDLHVRWEVGGQGKGLELEGCDEVLNYLCMLVGRWRRLRLSVVRAKFEGGAGEVWHWHANTFASRAARMLGAPMPHLEELEMEPYSTVCAEALRWNAPRLRVLTMVDAGVGLSPMGLLTGAGGSWPSLKSFTSRYPLDVSKALQILKLCPALEECDLAVVACHAAPYAHARVTPVVRARGLRRLVVRETVPRMVDALFRMLALPRLEELGVYVESGNWSCESRERWAVRELVMMVLRSGELDAPGAGAHSGGYGDGKVVVCKLRKLVIRGLECDEGAVKCLVFGIPSLVSLDVKNKAVDVGGSSWVQNLRTARRTV